MVVMRASHRYICILEQVLKKIKLLGNFIGPQKGSWKIVVFTKHFQQPVLTSSHGGSYRQLWVFQAGFKTAKMFLNSAFRYGGTRSRDRQQGKGPYTP